MSTASLQRREAIPELQIVRAMAILGVLSVHSTSYATLKMVNSGYYFLYNFFNIFMKFGTPTFIFLSSFVLFYNYYTRPLDAKLIGSFYKRRALYIIIPYLVFSIIYFTLLHYNYYPNRPLDETLSSFWDKVLTGNAYTHLYFVFISIQFYLLLPLFLWLLKKFPALVKWAIPAGFAIQWAFVLINKYVLTTPIPNKGSYSLSYFSYYLMGAAIGIYFPKIKHWIIMNKQNATKSRVIAWIALWCLWIGAGLWHVSIWYDTRLKIDSYHSLLYEFLWNMHTFFSALVLLQLGFLLYRKAAPWLVSLLSKLGALSFGIYLVHPFILFYYREYPPVTGNSLLLHSWYVGGYAAALVGSWIIVSLAARFLPISWVLFGNLPKPGKRPQTPSAPQKDFTA